MRRLIHMVPLLALALAVAACSNSAQLKKPFVTPAANGKAILEIIDKTCTTQPEKLSLLRERLLFYFEYSVHAQTNDPPVQPCPTCLDTTERVNLINKSAVQLAAQSIDRKYDIATFTNSVVERTPGFVDDPTGVAQTLVGDTGTNLNDIHNALMHATDKITSDVLQNHHEGVTRYNFFLLTSQEPNFDDLPLVLHPSEDPANILALVDDLVTMQNTFGVFDITLNIVLLAALSDNIANAVNLYTQMVNKTGGKLVVVYPTSGGPNSVINVSDFDFFNTLVPTMNIDEFMVLNLNARLDSSTVSQVIVDSDADGLSDEEEAVLGTDPQHVDTDGDLFDDRIEQLAASDPLVADHICLTSDQVDDDTDGLRNCVEFSLNLDPFQWDSDNDRIPDYLEIIYRTNPNANDAQDDADQDGIKNLEEIRLGLDPLHFQSQDDEEFFSQQYEINISVDTEKKIKCMEMTVNNIPLVNTLSSNRNLIEVQYQEVPDNPVPVKVLRRSHYLTQGTQDDDGPEEIKIFIDPETFTSKEQEGN